MRVPALSRAQYRYAVPTPTDTGRVIMEMVSRCKDLYCASGKPTACANTRSVFVAAAIATAHPLTGTVTTGSSVLLGSHRQQDECTGGVAG